MSRDCQIITISESASNQHMYKLQLYSHCIFKRLIGLKKATWVLLWNISLGNMKIIYLIEIFNSNDSTKELQRRGQRRIRNLRCWMKTVYIFRFALIYCMLLSWIMIIIFEIFHFWLGILQNRILQIIQIIRLHQSRSGGAIVSEIEGVDVKLVGTLQNIGTFIYVGTSFTACKNLIYF